MILFEKDRTAAIVTEASAEEPVLLAAADLRRDLCRLSGQAEGFPITWGEPCGILIATRPSSFPAGAYEAYTVRVEKDRVVIEGSDTLGTVYGIYAFSSKCLGVLPVWRMVDLFPDVRERMDLKPQTFSSRVRPICFRGWFLNDEDLLSDFRESGGHRDIDYPFYQNVMDTGVLDMVLETALRLEINLVIPSSFVDINNPAEEALVRTVCRRGMYVSQHHVEPMGVSYFAADAYMKQHGTQDETVSFIGNRARMEEIWRYYAQKWAVYGDRVVWQFGLRGKADQSVWKADKNVPMSLEARGGIITDAIATQHRIVKEVLGHGNFHSTATLWMEGAELYGKGYLQIPNDTVVVFCDIGYSQLFGDDFYRMTRKPQQRYGVYYHVGFWVEGPHLAEGCDLRKMAFSYREAWEQKSLYYSILNVSNVRPFHFSAWFHSELLKDPSGLKENETVAALLQAFFGKAAAQIEPLLWEYYDTIADLGKDEIRERCTRQEFYYHDYGELPFPEEPATDGLLRGVGMKILQKRHYTVNDENFAKALRESLAGYERLYARMQATEPALPAEKRPYFNRFLKFETFYMQQMTRWVLAARDLMQATDSTACNEAYRTATAALQSILEARKVLEEGFWQGWHKGDGKIGVNMLLELTKRSYSEKTEELA